MESLKDETPGRITIDEFSEGSLVKVTVQDEKTRAKLVSQLYSNMRLKQDLAIGRTRVRRASLLLEAHGRKITKPEDLSGASLPALLLFRFSSHLWLDVHATLTETGEKVHFEFRDDELGERVIVGKVHSGPALFHRAAAERWHVKLIGNRPVGKIKTLNLKTRLKKNIGVAFHDPVVSEHLSGPEMILEHFIKTIFLTTNEHGEEVGWAADVKRGLMEELKTLNLFPNAMDELVDLLGGPRKVAEMSGRNHRMKRKKDGTLAYVARSEELRCSSDGVNLVEQEFFQKGVKKACILTEVAAAGISLHCDRRQVRKDFAPPRRMMISVELPWGADKAIQSFGRVHRANQLQPPRFKILCTPIAGEIRFTSAISRRMKLLGAVTKGDRMTSMGGGADKHMAEFDVNNIYGVRALTTLYKDTAKITAAAPDLLEVYEAMHFLGDTAPATGRWPDWQTFTREVEKVWRAIRMYEDMNALVGGSEEVQRGSTKESGTLNRFFNRLLMLDIDLQGAIFEVFFAIYTELVRIDKSNGEFDEGVENLNDWHGRRIQRVEIEASEVLYTDPRSGAETVYHKLSLDRGTSWDVAKEMFDQLDPVSQEGFYCYQPKTSDKPVYFLAKERQQVGGAGGSAATWHAQKRKRQYVVWKPDFDEGSRQIALETHLSAAGCERIEGAKELKAVEDGWKECYEESKEKRLIKVHILTGDVLTVWRLANNIGKAEKPDANAASPVAQSLEGEADGQDLVKEGQEDDAGDKTEGDKPVEQPKIDPQAWSFVEEPPLNPHEIGALQKDLQIVRAVTKRGTGADEEELPLVGLKVSEADLPKLKYVLACQHKAVREEKVDEKKSLRETTMEAAKELAKRVREAPDRKLPYASWLDVHKALAADGIVAYGATGMRATQIAVDRLDKAKVISADGDGMGADVDVTLDNDDELEQLIFPEEFIHNVEEQDPLMPKKNRKSSTNGFLNEWEEALFDEDELSGFDDDADEPMDDDGTQETAARPSGFSASKVRLRPHARKSKAEARPEKKDKKDKKRKKDKNETKEERSARKKRKRLGKENATDGNDDKDDPALFEDLFGVASEKEGEGSATSSKARPPATPAKAPTAPGLAAKLRDEVGKVLSGLDLQNTNLRQVRGLMETNLGYQPGALDEHKEYIGTLLQEQIQQNQQDEPMQEKTAPPKKEEKEYESWTTEKLEETLENLGLDSDGDRADLIARLATLDGPAAPKPAPPPPAASSSAATPSAAVASDKESETGKIWTYEVTGKKIGIREGPSIETEPQGEYLENGELFNVTERVRGGGDVRVYLRLADGRGWAYDRSAKDADKVVVDELGSKSI